MERNEQKSERNEQKTKKNEKKNQKKSLIRRWVDGGYAIICVFLYKQNERFFNSITYHENL